MRWLLVVLAACDHGAASRDAAPPDGTGVDTTITVTRSTKPFPGAPVFFQAPDGTVLASVRTDLAGVATATIASHAIVTVVEAFVNQNRVSTFVDVPPGDHLTLDDIDGPRPARQVSVTIPVDPDPSVDHYIVNHGCGGGVGTVLDLPADCGSTDDLLVRSASITGDVGMIVALDTPIIATTMTVTGPFTPCTNEQFSFTNTNAPGVTTALLSPAIGGSHGAMVFANLGLDLRSGSASVTLPSLVQPGVNQVVFLGVSTETFGLVHYVTSTVPTSAAFTLDLGAALLPNLTAPAFDIATHRATWQESGGALTPDMMLADIPVARPLPDGGMVFWDWRVVAPHTPGELVLPVLPVGDFDFNPQPGDNVSVFELELLQVPGGYDALRANALSDVHNGVFGGGLPMDLDMPTAPSRASAVVFGR
jgi:hypothetical protein